jgi:hypothetical protein
MTTPYLRTGLLTIAHGELFVAVPTPIPGRLSLPAGDGWSVVPVPGGVGEGPFGEFIPRELRDYLDYGSAFTGLLELKEEGGALTLTGARNLYPVQFPTPEGRARLDAIMSAAEQLATYRDARLKNGIEVTIEDWQGPEREDKTTPDQIRLTIQAEEQRLLITARDGRKLDLELQDGALRAMAYENEDGKQAPVITALPPQGEIVTDRHDYDLEARPAADEPGM